MFFNRNCDCGCGRQMEQPIMEPTINKCIKTMALITILIINNNLFFIISPILIISKIKIK